jgi:uroporphyrinogen decarboxylase
MPQKETMTPLERWQAVLSRKTPDRVPMDYWSTPEFSEKLMKFLGCRTRVEMRKKLYIDFIYSAGPEYSGPKLPRLTDVFGCRYQNINYGAGTYGEVIYHPLAGYRSLDEIKKKYRWPDPDWWDYSQIATKIRYYRDYPIQGGGSEPFLKYKDLRGHEQAMVDLVENPEIVSYCMDRLFELAYQNTLRIFEAIPGKVFCTNVAEDMGSQKGLLFSPVHIRQFLFPGMKRMIDLAHQAGVYVFHHNDGNVQRILPELVQLGIDILNPIQWRADGMDRAYLKKTYGDQLVFHGAVDNQYTLPFGTQAEVRQEVLDNLAILGSGGGYILAPCHNIQPITPPENVVTMYETCREASWTN